MTTAVSPSELSELLIPVVETGLFGFDVDGVLAPIVEHAHDARLLPGTRLRLAALAERAPVVILSGRALDDLERLFHFPTGLHVIGSHGLEARDADPMQLTDDERTRFEQLEAAGRRAVEAAGDGAWLEHKPASVVVHIRSADAALAPAAIDELLQEVAEIDGAFTQCGHEVAELLTRRASKGDALTSLAWEYKRGPVVFFGDDLTDEDAFAMMSTDDISIRVGPGDTLARYRLASPEAVARTIDAVIA